MEQYLIASVGGYNYQKKIYLQKYPYGLFCREDWRDIHHAAVVAGWQAWKNTSDSQETFYAACRAAQKEIRLWLNPRIRKLETPYELPLLPILRIARTIYAHLRKKGERGRRSAVLKAFIVQQKCNEKTCGEIALMLEATRYATTEANVRRHWLSALGLIFGQSRGNISR